MSFVARCVLFDLDGTLVDTAPDLGAAANAVREKLGLPPLPLINYRPFASAGARGLLGAALGITPQHLDFEAHRKFFLDYYRAHLSHYSALFEGMDEILRGFERTSLRWGVVTNKPAWLTQPLMQELHLDTRAACCISGDDVPKPKPAPDSLRLACTQLGVQPQDCVYVGDDKRDIDAARAASMPCIAADWGYLGSDGPISGWNADVIAQTPTQLATLIRSAV